MDYTQNNLTFTEFKKSTYKTVQLSLWFVWQWKNSHKNEAINDILRNRVDIFRKTALFSADSMDADNPSYDNPIWIDLENTISEIYQHNFNNLEQFVVDSSNVFKKTVDEALEYRWTYFQNPKHLKCGSLTYNHPDKGNSSMIAIHIANAVKPKSIFDDHLYLPKCLIDFLNKTEDEFAVDTIHCGSWLNSHPRWLELFPQEYHNSLSLPDENIQWHLGFWGQFVNAKGGFHERNAKKFRKKGEMPFAYRTAECSFVSMREHLKKKFNQS